MSLKKRYGVMNAAEVDLLSRAMREAHGVELILRVGEPDGDLTFDRRQRARRKLAKIETLILRALDESQRRERPEH